MGGVVQAKEAREADQRTGLVQLDLWEEAEGVRQRSAVRHVRGRLLEKYVGKTVGELDLAVVEGPPRTFFLLGKVAGRRT